MPKSTIFFINNVATSVKRLYYYQKLLLLSNLLLGNCFISVDHCLKFFLIVARLKIRILFFSKA